MKLFPYRYVKVADGMRVRVSNHFFHSNFGITSGQNLNAYSRQYVCEGTPGTGFVVRDSDSHSYHAFVERAMARNRPRYWRMVAGLEPDYRREAKKAKAAIAATDDPLKRQVLDCYVNALGVAETADYVQRIERGLKEQMHKHHHSKYLISVYNHYRRKMRQLDADMRSVELDLRNTCSEAQYEAWQRLTEVFGKVAACRRVWHQQGERNNDFAPVYFDMGTFDYIRTDSLLPIMRTQTGVTYYILPTCLLAVRSSTDFDVLPVAEVSVVCQEMAVQETIELMSSRLGDAASMLRMPSIGQTWYFNHVRPVMQLVGAYDELRQTV